MYITTASGMQAVLWGFLSTVMTHACSVQYWGAGSRKRGEGGGDF